MRKFVNLFADNSTTYQQIFDILEFVPINYCDKDKHTFIFTFVKMIDGERRMCYSSTNDVSNLEKRGYINCIFKTALFKGIAGLNSPFSGFKYFISIDSEVVYAKPSVYKNCDMFSIYRRDKWREMTLNEIIDIFM